MIPPGSLTPKTQSPASPRSLRLHPSATPAQMNIDHTVLVAASRPLTAGWLYVGSDDDDEEPESRYGMALTMDV